jgi:hypothetical protein
LSLGNGPSGAAFADVWVGRRTAMARRRRTCLLYVSLSLSLCQAQQSSQQSSSSGVSCPPGSRRATWNAAPVSFWFRRLFYCRVRLTAAPSNGVAGRGSFLLLVHLRPDDAHEHRLLHGHPLLPKGFFASPAPPGRLDSPVAGRRSAVPESNPAKFKP